MKSLKFLFPLIIGFLLAASCGDKDEPGSDPCNSTFDQAAMFENIAENLIIPQFSELTTRTNDLSTASNNFVINPNGNTLENVRTAMIESWKTWQQAAQYSFGPAEDVFLRNSVNNFPLNLDETIIKIESGSKDFSSPDDFDKGFPALDYLLFGVADTDDAIIDFYKNSDNSNYSDYLNAVSEDIRNRVSSTSAAWQSGYSTQFISNTGTAAGTSLSQIINGLNQNYELIKREKIGIPSGVLTLGFANSEKVEARYSGISSELARIALLASRDLYLGNQTNGTTGIGLDDFLTEVKQIDLNESIKNQFEVAVAALGSLSENLAVEVEENQQEVIVSYNEITKNLVHLKTDLPSVLCVSITYIDNPSDSD